MTANPNPIDAPAVLEYLQQAEPDLLRSMLAAFVQALMGADADAQCGAEYGARSPDRTNQGMVTGSGSGTPGPARSSSRSRNCAKAPTSPTGCSSDANEPNEH